MFKCKCWSGLRQRRNKGRLNGQLRLNQQSKHWQTPPPRHRFLLLNVQIWDKGQTSRANTDIHLLFIIVDLWTERWKYSIVNTRWGGCYICNNCRRNTERKLEEGAHQRSYVLVDLPSLSNSTSSTGGLNCHKRSKTPLPLLAKPTKLTMEVGVKILGPHCIEGLPPIQLPEQQDFRHFLHIASFLLLA